MISRPSRRALLGTALALAACERPGRAAARAVPVPPLREAATFRIGTAVQSGLLGDADFAALVVREVSQLTAEWEMKMEYIVLPDGSFRFDAPDAIAAFAKAHGLALFGHALVWHAQRPAAFVQLDPKRASFRQAFANYISAVVGRYRGGAVAWDVVNEAVAEDGAGWRTSLWSERLGAFEHMRLAFELAHDADPAAVLFLNDYNLENLPAKRATFLRLAESLLKAGAPLGGLGSQTHVRADLPAGAIATCLADLSALGLPIRISEMDVSLAQARGGSAETLAAGQAALFDEAATAMMALPGRQRFDVTFWGLRDRDSWLVSRDPGDTPLLFDSAGRAKPAVAAFESGLLRKG